MPELGEEVRHSDWITGVPGLARAVAGWEHELAGHRSTINDRTRRVARPGLLSPGRVVRQSVAVAAATLEWALRRLPDDLGSGRPLAQTGEWLQDSAGYVLRDDLANLGPAAAELGRIITDSEGIIPDFMVAELRRRPLPNRTLSADAADEIVDRSLPGRLGELGGVQSSTPASQLHEGVLRDGTPVLVRVGRPGVGRDVRQDARIAATALAPFEALVPILAAIQPLGLVELISRQLAEASDLRNEALNAIELGLVIERLAIKGLDVCRPLPGLVTAEVAVFEAPPGGGWEVLERPRVNDDGPVGASPRRAIDVGPVARLVLDSALSTGVFAADLRANEVLAHPEGRLCLTGCGAIGRLDLTTRRAVLDLLPALLSGDGSAQVSALRDLEMAPDGPAADLLLADLAAIRPAHPFGLFGGQGGGMGAMGQDALTVVLRHGLTPPPELVQLGRAVLALRTLLHQAGSRGGLLAVLLPLLGRFSRLRAELG